MGLLNYTTQIPASKSTRKGSMRDEWKERAEKLQSQLDTINTLYKEMCDKSLIDGAFILKLQEENISLRKALIKISDGDGAFLAVRIAREAIARK